MADEKIERFKLSDIGYSGLKMFDGISNEEDHRELNHPHSIKTYRTMSYHPAINAPLTLMSAMVGKARFRVVEPENASEEEKNQTRIIKEMLHDMDVTMEDVVAEVMTMNTYGFCVMEKVYRRRLPENGSQYSDGLIAPKKLAFRNQESIEKFIYDESGNEVIGVKQNISLLHDPHNRFKNRKQQFVIPRSKFMLFNVGRSRTNPFGTSPLRDVYLPWKYLTTVEELEAAGVAKDLQGIPVLKIPAQYMSEDASPEQKIIFEQFKAIIRNLQMNTQSGILLPSTVDPETREALFSIDLLSTEGGKKSYDTTAVKDYYRTMIFIGMMADILLMGNTATGSFALGSIKTSLTGTYIEGILRRIIEVFNNDLIRQIYELNGWNVARRCSLDSEDFEDINFDEFSKAIQRIGAVGYLPKTLEVINKILNMLGVDALPEGTDIEELLPESTTRAGEGMEEGMGSGTGKSSGKSGDASSSNVDD